MASSRTSNSARQVETRGIEPVPEGECHGHPLQLFWVWFAANISILGLPLGATLVAFQHLAIWQAALGRGDRRGGIVRDRRRDFDRRTTRACTESHALACDLRRARQHWADHRLAVVAARLGNRQHDHRRLRAAVARDHCVRHACGSQERAGADARVHRRVRGADVDRVGTRSRYAAGDPEVVHLCVRRAQPAGGRFSGDGASTGMRFSMQRLRR